MFLGTCLLGTAISSVVAAEEGGAKRAPPKSIQEAKERLEEVFGRFDPDDHHEWRIIVDDEYRTQVAPNVPEVLLRSTSVKTVSHPFSGPDSAGFDEISQFRRNVFDVGAEGQTKLTRTQVSHNVTRYSVVTIAGEWFANGTMLSNGVHSTIGQSTFRGTVKWHDDGFELTGAWGVDRYYAPAGKFILGTAFGSVRYLREGDTLIIRVDVQPYHLAKDPSGNLTQFPDFARPFGTRHVKEFRSEPRGMSK